MTAIDLPLPQKKHSRLIAPYPRTSIARCNSGTSCNGAGLPSGQHLDVWLGRPPTEPDVAQFLSEEASWYRHAMTWYLDSQGRAGYTYAEGCARYLPVAAHDSILEVSCLTLKASEMKFLVVDDHALIRDAMRGVLKELEGGAIVLEAASARQAMDLIPQHPRSRSHSARSAIA